MEHLKKATSLHHIAYLYNKKGKYDMAAPLYERALEIREKELGSEHPDTATSLNNLALVYNNQR
ncbi:TPR repeat-containing protein, partial [Jimgerdemannia flammicorona]